MKKIFQIDGGIGRVIAFTGAIELLKTKEPDSEISIITNHPDIFFNNPNVERVYPSNTSFLWDVIKDQHYFYPEPYAMFEHYHDFKHVVNCFSLLLTGEDKFEMPKFYLSEEELGYGKAQIGARKVILFQPWGQTGGVKNDVTHRSLHLDYAQKIADALLSKGFEVVLVKDPSQPNLKGCQMVTGIGARQIASLLPFVKYAIGIDSFLQHAAAALNIPMSVFWGGTKKEMFGYEMHHNIENGKEVKFVPNRLPSNIINLNTWNAGVDTHDDARIDDILIKL